MNQNKLYDAVPYRIQQLLLNLYALKINKERFGKRFKAIMAQLNTMEHYTEEDIATYQDDKLKALVVHCYQNIPYYRELFDSLKLKPADINGRADLYKIPVITKSIIKANFEKLIDPSALRAGTISYGSTSGTTGSPLKVGWDTETCIFNNALDWRHKKWAGINVGDSMAVFFGRPIVSFKRNNPPYWQKNYIHNQTWFSAFHISNNTLPDYLKQLQKLNPVAIEAYPSTAYMLAQYMNRHGIKLPVKAIFTSSEPLYPVQRSAIETAFGCQVYDYYGLAERCVVATECEAHEHLHLNFEYAYTELSTPEGGPTDTGLITSTNLINQAMPLLRYQTSDVTNFIHQPCECGRPHPRIKRIETKSEDVIYTPSGKSISPSVLTHPFKPITTIEKSQIVQTDPDRILIRLVKGQGFKNNDEVELREGLAERLGKEIQIDIEYLEDIPIEASGKFRWVISKLKKR